MINNYYSWFEFDNQIEELLKYNPKYFWFDGHWFIKQKSIIDKIFIITKKIIDDGIIINDRIGGNDLSICNYRVFSDRFIPEKKLDIKWQHINTIGYSLGYNRMNAHSDYKTGEQIHKLKLKIKNLGGELLLNIGPNYNGIICKEELNCLQYLGINSI
jgi:alpha-L-fucosidase